MTRRFNPKLVAGLSLAGLLLTAGCKGGGQTGTTGGTTPMGPVTKSGAAVAALDPDVIYKLPEYADMNKKLNDDAQTMAKQLEADVKARKVKPEQLAVERLQMQQKLEQERNQLQTPLNNRVASCIADLAKKNGYNVVLDRRIVLTGVTDITDQVKNAFEASKGTTSSASPDANTGTDSGVGYVNEDTISDLKMFHDAQGQLQQYYLELQKEFQEKAKKATATQRGELQQMMMQKFQAKKAALYQPLQGKVNDIIAQVAKDQNLSLVLDTRQVMWGGKNITTDVIERLVKTGKS